MILHSNIFSKQNLENYIHYIVIYIILLIVISKNLFTPYLDFDEAGQFFIAKGLHHYSDPLDSPMGIHEVIEMNKYYNMDPGGFGILLHYWSFISNHHVWLKLLPFLFFLGALISFIYLIYYYTKNKKLALFIGFSFILIDNILAEAFDLRAYSMEYLGTLLSIIGLEKIKEKVTIKNLLFWGLVFSFFITSRYAELIIIAIVSIFIALNILKTHINFKTKLWLLIAYSLPLILTALYIYFNTTYYQNRHLATLYPNLYLNTNPAILQKPSSLFYLLILFGLIVLSFYSKRNKLYVKFQSLLSLTITINIAFIILSYAGIHPWNPENKRCLSILLCTLLTVLVFLCEMIKPVFKVYKVEIGLIGLAVLLVWKMEKKVFHPKVNAENIELFSEYDEISLITLKENVIIYVGAASSPSLRYLFEYGKFKNRTDIYPKNFFFEKADSHALNHKKIKGIYKASKNLALKNCDILIHAYWDKPFFLDKVSLNLHRLILDYPILHEANFLHVKGKLHHNAPYHQSRKSLKTIPPRQYRYR